MILILWIILQNSFSLWLGFLQQLRNYKSPILLIKNLDVISDSDKAELFKAHLSDTFQPHPDITFHANTIIVNDYLNSPLPPSSVPVKHFTLNEIKFAINKFSLKKSLGYDLITVEVARCLPKKAIIYLSHIFNSVLRLSHLPILWTFSTIILVSKHNKPLDSISSFRPILYNIYAFDQSTTSTTVVAYTRKTRPSYLFSPTLTYNQYKTSNLTSFSWKIGTQTRDLKLTIQNLFTRHSPLDLLPAVTSLFMVAKFQML